MGTTITIKLKGQPIIYFSSSSTILWFLALKIFLVFLVFLSLDFYVVLGYVHWRDRRYKGGAPIREEEEEEEEEEDKQTQEREQPEL